MIPLKIAANHQISKWHSDKILIDYSISKLFSYGYAPSTATIDNTRCGYGKTLTAIRSLCYNKSSQVKIEILSWFSFDWWQYKMARGKEERQ